jgi:hypothetical protein
VKNPSIDTFYLKLNKHILLLQAYLEIPELSFLIRGCRLKPHNYVFGQRPFKTTLYFDWFDEFGNSYLIRDKKIQIVQQDLSLRDQHILCTDLYYGLSLDRVIKMSKMIYLCNGLDEDLQQPTFFITCLGLDNYLRSYLSLYGQCRVVSSLLLGMERLQVIARYCDIQYFRTLPKMKKYPLPCQTAEECVSCLPAPPALTEWVKQHNLSSMFILLNAQKL